MKRSREQGKPFFCYIPTNAPHGPHLVPNKYAQPYVKAAGIFANRIGMIANIDENVGKLMGFLKSSGMEENTILIFLTDNGAARGRSGNAGMRGGKGSGYDGGHRVPFLIHWPKGGIAGGRDDDTLTAHIDILPTLIDLCDIKADKATVFDGVSFKPLLTGGEKPKSLDRILVESYRGVVMTEQWRLVGGNFKRPQGNPAVPKWELYDIQKDPAQNNDVAKDHPDLVKQFRDVLAKNRSHDHKGIPRFIIGSERQPHQAFTIYHWFDLAGFYNQSKVTHGQLVNGIIPIAIAQPGIFEFTLRRWPPELNVPIRSKPSGPVEGFKLWGDQNFKAIDIRSARLKVAHFDRTKPVTDKTTSVTFTVELKAGETDIQTWSHTGNDRTLGAYYLDVHRLEK